MIEIFFNFIEDIIAVFTDDFSEYVHHLTIAYIIWKVLQINLVLNWESCHIMAQEGVVFGHAISSKGIEVDKQKVKVIKNCHHKLLSRV